MSCKLLKKMEEYDELVYKLNCTTVDVFDVNCSTDLLLVKIIKNNFCFFTLSIFD